MRNRAWLILALLAACSTSPNEVPGSADITGQVLLATGTPPAAATVTVIGLDSRVAPAARTDSTGRYSLHLDGVAGHQHCAFVVAATGGYQFALDTTITFFTAGLHPLQIIDIRQPPTP